MGRNYLAHAQGDAINAHPGGLLIAALHIRPKQLTA